MSVIFETLQKLKQGDEGISDRRPVSRKRRKTISMGQVFLSLGIVLAAGAGLAVFCLWGSFQMHRVPDQQLRGSAVAGQDFSTMPAKEKTPETGVNNPSSKEVDVSLQSSPPDRLKVRAVKGKLYLPPSGRNRSGKREPARFLSPTQQDGGAFSGAAEKRGLQHRAASGKNTKPVKSGGEEAQKKEVSQSVYSKGADQNPFKALATIAAIKDTGETEVVSKLLHQKKSSPEPFPEIEKSEDANKEKSVSPPPRQMETTAVHTVDRSAQMALLVARLQQAMRRGDEQKVKTLLERLESIKGRSDYVMRVRAFWYLKKGEYDMARPLLQQLIAKNEEDVEAGINMAVLDIRTNRLEAARKRLRDLRRLHEENTMIPALLEKISR